MSEVIYTKINPKFYIDEVNFIGFSGISFPTGSGHLYKPNEVQEYPIFRKSTPHTPSIHKALRESIKKEGIKFPVMGLCVKRKIKEFPLGKQRMIIALDLGIIEVPAILYSKQKTGFEGEIIRGLDDIVKLFGNDIKEEGVYWEFQQRHFMNTYF